MIHDRRIDLERRRDATLQRRADSLTAEIVIPLHHDVGLERVSNLGHVCRAQRSQVRPNETVAALRTIVPVPREMAGRLTSRVPQRRVRARQGPRPRARYR